MGGDLVLRRERVCASRLENRRGGKDQGAVQKSSKKNVRRSMKGKD